MASTAAKATGRPCCSALLSASRRLPISSWFRPPDAKFHTLELKRKGEVPSDEHTGSCGMSRRLGGVWGWANSYDSAKQLLHFWGAIKRISE